MLLRNPGIEEYDSVETFVILSWVVRGFVVSEDVSLLFWIVGGIGILFIDLEGFSGVIEGLSLFRCGVGGDGVFPGYLEGLLVWQKFHHQYFGL